MLSPINDSISQKLKDKGYRQRFFKGRAEDEIAYALRRFRKLRGLNQSQLAKLCGMKQSAISRIEQASYSKWNFSTLWRIAEALDVRVRVMIDDMADALREYELLDTANTGIFTNEIIANPVWGDIETFSFTFHGHSPNVTTHFTFKQECINGPETRNPFLDGAATKRTSPVAPGNANTVC